MSGPRSPGRALAEARPAALALVAMVAAGACWGLAAVMARVAFDRGVPPVRMAEARVVVALVLLGLALAVARPELLRPPRGSLPVLAIFGVAVALVNGTYYVAIDRLPVGVAISLQYTAPVLLLLGEAAAGRRRAGAWAWGSAALTLAGSILVTRAYAGLERADPAGLAAGAGSALSFAAYLLAAGEAGRRGVPPPTLLFWGFAVAIAAWTVVAPWWSWPAGRLADREVVLAVVGVGVLGTLVPFLLAVRAVPVLSPALAGVAATVEPPFAAAFAWLLLGQHLTPVQLGGGLLVLAGVALTQRAPVLGREALAVEPTA